MESVKRSYTLDSIKFFSMVIVYLCHLKMSFFPEKDVSLSIANLSIPNYLFNGNLAVCMFILISVYLSAEKAFNFACEPAYHALDALPYAIHYVLADAYDTGHERLKPTDDRLYNLRDGFYQLRDVRN